jgi:NAD(P)-dependent dehydrogenase (short-subunit alcohol dehydrogenase family)
MPIHCAAFDGLDTLHICFGVSALRPLLGIAGVDPVRKVKRADLLSNLPAQSDEIEADVSGLKVIQAANDRINQINVTATSMVLTAFVSVIMACTASLQFTNASFVQLPMLQLTSASPSINLLSSIAAYIPAPTRALYGSSKAAQLLLFQSVGIEADSQSKANCTPKRAKVRFHATTPATIFSNFRNSAVDGSVESSQAQDDTWQGKSDALTPSYVASECIFAVDRLKEGVQEMPAKYWLARRLTPYL